MDDPGIFNQKSLSLWLKDGLSGSIPELTQDIACDVCIVGAGITGITTAYRLHEAGLKAVLIDKQEPVHLASGNTTAKFTFQHDLIYSRIIKNDGLDKAKLYYQAQMDGLNYVRSLIERYGIPCDFKETSSVIYAKTQKQLDDLLVEKSAYEQLNIPHEIIGDIPMGIVGTGGLIVPGQFELNPVKYLNFFISILQKDGMPIFQNTAAKTVEEEGDLVKVLTQNGHTITCNHLVIATAYPFFEGGGMYFTRLEASRSYLTAFPITQAADDEYMMISSGEDTYSLRFSDTDGVKYLLVGGQGHKVGQADSEIDSYNRLILFARSHFEVDEPAFRWSAQDYKSLDSIPYIGRLTAKHHHIFTATGFNKWGMSNGSFAAAVPAAGVAGVVFK